MILSQILLALLGALIALALYAGLMRVARPHRLTRRTLVIYFVCMFGILLVIGLSGGPPPAEPPLADPQVTDPPG